MLLALSFRPQDALSVELRQKDARWLQQLRWLQLLSPQELHLEPEFCMSYQNCGAAGLQTYSAAAAGFAAWAAAQLPAQALCTLMAAVRCLHREAAACSGRDESSLNLSQIFPILVWALIHSGIRHIHRALAFAHCFNDCRAVKEILHWRQGDVMLKGSIHGQASYWCAQVEMAAVWICEQKKEEYNVAQ